MQKYLHLQQQQQKKNCCLYTENIPSERKLHHQTTKTKQKP